MRKVKLFALVVLALGTLALADGKYVCKISHAGTNSAIVTCTNNADPTAKKLDDNILLISCGK